MIVLQRNLPSANALAQAQLLDAADEANEDLRRQTEHVIQQLMLGDDRGETRELHSELRGLDPASSPYRQELDQLFHKATLLSYADNYAG